MLQKPTPIELAHAQALWDFHTIRNPLAPADFILALGSHDERVADCASTLFLKGLAPLLVTSGGLGKVTKDLWRTTEGERFAEIAKQAGVPQHAIIVERNAANTGDNIVFTRDLLHDRGISVRSGLLVTKPYMSRRALATATKQWPDVAWSVSSPEISFHNYPNAEVPIRKTISLMVGDLQRLKIYADQGFQTPQNVPAAVWDSYEFLRQAGYDDFIVPID